jgi:hypothetical protein
LLDAYTTEEACGPDFDEDWEEGQPKNSKGYFLRLKELNRKIIDNENIFA